MATYPVAPTLKYNQASKANYQVRSIQSNFGDGYQEVTPDGINFIVQNGTLSHQLLSLADAVTLRTFLKANCGTSNTVTILNMMEDPTGATTLEVFLSSWTESYIGTHYNFSVAYRQAFN